MLRLSELLKQLEGFPPDAQVGLELDEETQRIHLGVWVEGSAEEFLIDVGELESEEFEDPDEIR